MQVELVACTAHGIRLAIAWNVRKLASKRKKSGTAWKCKGLNHNQPSI